MPLELGVWRIDQGVAPVEFGPLDLEARLEEILERNIEIASPAWMVIGRQLRTAYDKYIDLLAIDSAGDLVVLELKRDRTYRDIVSQLLDYGSWVRELRSEEISQIFSDYQKRFRSNDEEVSINEAFVRRFRVKEMPEELNNSHSLVIVASEVDLSTERVVLYLSEEYGVSINVIFFRVFKDGGREYLSRAWLREPTVEGVRSGEKADLEWNGEYYVSFGGHEARRWEEARKFGFISAGGGTWYTRTLDLLEPGARIWVNIPGTGYVGVGEVEEEAVPVDHFEATDREGNRRKLIDVAKGVSQMSRAEENPEKAEMLVRVRWIKTVLEEEAIREKGFFGNQNTVAQPPVRNGSTQSSG